MPVPTPPKVNLLETVKPVRLPSKAKKQPAEPSKSTQKLSKEIKDLTETLDANSVDIPEDKPAVKGPDFKKKVFRPTAHLTTSPFRDSEDMRRLQRELKKDADPKKPVKRAPKRRPAANKTTGEK